MNIQDSLWTLIQPVVQAAMRRNGAGKVMAYIYCAQHLGYEAPSDPEKPSQIQHVVVVVVETVNCGHRNRETTFHESWPRRA